MSGVEIRDVTPADAEGLARVHTQGWQEAYTGRMPQAILDARTVEDRTRFWADYLERPEARTRTRTAVRDGSIVGFSGWGRSETDPDLPLLWGLYVYATEYGTGTGQRLLDAALGDSAAELWVLDDNPRAQAFYRKNRFAFDGTEKLQDFPGGSIRELRMLRPAP